MNPVKTFRTVADIEFPNEELLTDVPVVISFKHRVIIILSEDKRAQGFIPFEAIKTLFWKKIPQKTPLPTFSPPSQWYRSE